MAAVPAAQQAQIQQAAGAGAARSQYDLAFQISPIILVGGIAASASGGMLPIIALYGQTNLVTGGVDANGNPIQPASSTDQFFAKFMPLPGTTLISQSIGSYPFANQQVAANATIQQPLTVSLLMIAPVNQPGGYLTKLSTFTALQGSLAAHNALDGTYSVATPAFIFTDLLMTSMTDITHGDQGQPQIEWQIDFVQPLISLAAASRAESNLMSIISGGGQISNPGWTLPNAANPAALAGLNAAVLQFGGNLPIDSFNPSALPGAGQGGL